MAQSGTRCRRALRAAVAGAVLLIVAIPANAKEQVLSGLTYLARHPDGDAIVIDTSGAAKLRISFVDAATARIQIAPTGDFTPNPSPAVADPAARSVAVTVEDEADHLFIRTTALALRIDKRHLRIDAIDGATGKPLSLESPEGGTSWDTETGAISQSRLLAPGEHVFGLGQDNRNRGTLDRRGTIRDMWTGQQISSGNVTANYPVPFYLSTGRDGRGYGVFVDNVWRLKFDVGKTASDRLTWTAPGGPLDYYVITGPGFRSIINHYTALTGRPSMLPLHAFGYWQSRCFYFSFPEIQAVIDRFKKDGLPLDVMVIDSAWDTVDVDFKWNDKFLVGRKAEDWLADFHATGAHVMLSTKGPMIRSDAANFESAKKLGLFATDGQGNTLTAGYYGGQLMDFTHPAMPAWLSGQLSPLSKQGIDDWWLDLIEPEGEPPQAVYATGKSADIHNTYPLLNYKIYYDYQRSIDPDGRPVILGRAATAGTQRYSGIVWSGDVASDWPTFQAHVPEAQNSGLSGLPYWTNDSGGFLEGFLNDDRYGAHAELYTRWFQFTAFAPIMRAHKAGLSEPFQYGEQTEAIAKKYMQLRYRLLPYIYTAAHETSETGVPILRPLILDYQDDPQAATAKTQYMFGPDLLVAPVITPGTTARPVYFPTGHWISYDDGFAVEGGRTIGVAAPIDRIPLFVRAGAILPTAPDMLFSGEKPWDPVTLDIWPAGTSTGSLYQDDTNSTAWQDGQFTMTRFTSTETPGRSVALSIAPSNAQFGPKTWLARFHLTAVPTAVKIDGHAVTGWSFDDASGVLNVAVPGERKARRVDVALGAVHPRPVAPKVDAPPMALASTDVAPRQLPHFLPAPILPIRVEAANFDKGGVGLGFRVYAVRTDSVYRDDGVPIIASTDAGGGYAVPNLKQDKWLAYTLNAGKGGWFTISARVLAEKGGEIAVVTGDDKPLTTIAVAGALPARWADAPGVMRFHLEPGKQIIRLKVVKPGFTLANFTFRKSDD